MNYTRTLFTVHLLISISSIIYAGDVPDQEGALKMRKSDAQDLIRALFSSYSVLSNLRETHPKICSRCEQLDADACRDVQEALNTCIEKREEDLVALEHKVAFAGIVLPNRADTTDIMKNIANIEDLCDNGSFRRCKNIGIYGSPTASPSKADLETLRCECKGEGGGWGRIAYCDEYTRRLVANLRQEHLKVQKNMQEAVKFAKYYE